ncbi:MAG: SDR family oxidoreductase [Patescibacteria group bacterium]|jgi:2-C-methyl-D-erythritol 4-phosphate cytidylyltransferase
MNKNIGIILASGNGQRFGSTVPKQFVKLNGKPVFLYSYDAMQKSGIFQKIVITIPSEQYAYLIPPTADWIIGGATRNKSIYNCLMHIKQYSPDKIIIHDGARPLIFTEDFKILIDALKTHKAVSVSTKITDSLYPVIDRDQYCLTMSPEGFDYQFFLKYFDPNNDQCIAAYQHIPYTELKLITLSHPNYKITYPQDIFFLEHLLKYNQYMPHKPFLQNKNALLFGSTGGIGKSVAKKLKNAFANVNTLSSKDHNLLTDNFDFLPIYDIIINCSGIAYTDQDGILDRYDEVFKINLLSNLKIIEFAKKCKKRPINIVFISSSSATCGRENLTLYSASKAALHSVVESQAKILSQQGIYLNCICPEKVNTNMASTIHSNAIITEMLTPEEVATSILSYCDTKKYGNIIHIRKGLKIC